jgi:hypothetical protein
MPCDKIIIIRNQEIISAIHINININLQETEITAYVDILCNQANSHQVPFRIQRTKVCRFQYPALR